MKLRTGISPNYVKGWGVDKALREIVQNYLDTLAEFKCRGRISWANGYAVIKDNGPGLEMRHLALGVSEKSDMAKGQFGEGLKLALLVLAREGRDVTVQTKNQTIQPSIEHDEVYNTDVMVLKVKPGTQGFQGTTIKVACSQDELEQAKSYFIEYTKPNTMTWLDKGRLSSPGGYIYLNGTKIGNLDGAIFSYHLTGKMNLGNRDREVVDMNKVFPEIRRILAETKSNRAIQAIVFALLNATTLPIDLEAGMAIYLIPRNRRKAWRKAFIDAAGAAGKDTVLAVGDYEIDHYVQELGYNVVSIHNWEWTNVLIDLGIPNSRSVAHKRSSKNKTIPMTRLTELETTHLRTARRLIKHHYNDPKKVVIVDKIRDLSASTSTVDGYYNFGEDRIYLTRAVLSNQYDTLHTLLHECVHKYSGFSDNTREFETALLEVAVGIITRGGKKANPK